MTDVLTMYQIWTQELLPSRDLLSARYEWASQTVLRYLLTNQTEGPPPGCPSAALKTVFLHRVLFGGFTWEDPLLTTVSRELAFHPHHPPELRNCLGAQDRTEPTSAQLAHVFRALNRATQYLQQAPAGDELPLNYFLMTLYVVGQLPDLPEYVPAFQLHAWNALRSLLDRGRFHVLDQQRLSTQFQIGLDHLQRDPKLSLKDLLYWARMYSLLTLLILSYIDIKNTPLGAQCLTQLMALFYYPTTGESDG